MFSSLRKRTLFFGFLCFFCVLLLNVIPQTVLAQSYTLSTWYSYITIPNQPDIINNTIAYWEDSPTIRYCKLDTSPYFSFVSGLYNGCSEWNDALGTSVSISSTITDAPIVYIGGTIDQINGVPNYLVIDEFTLLKDPYGCTEVGGQGYAPQVNDQFTYYINNTPMDVLCYKQNFARGYIISMNRTYDQYVKTVTHEMGHALGWREHAQDSSWVMCQGNTSITSLSTQEKAHLQQIYTVYGW